MKYILLSEDNTVSEIIPEENPALPGISLDKRYNADFISKLLPVEDSVEVAQNWGYNPENGVFSAPVILDDTADPDPELTDAEALAIIVGGAVHA